MRFVVTGLSRSGTKYAAKLWAQAGYRCGHESVFNIFKVLDPPGSVGDIAGFADSDGDSSFLAAPFLDQLPEETVVFHQLRDPIEVVRSHLGIRFFADPPVPSIYLADNHSDFVGYITGHCPQVAGEPGEAERCMRYWVAWNEMIAERAERRRLRYFRYRLEDLHEELLCRMIAFLGDEPGKDLVGEAIASVSRTTNSRPRDDSVGWEDLPPGPAKNALLRAAETYGYAPLGIKA